LVATLFLNLLKQLLKLKKRMERVAARQQVATITDPVRIRLQVKVVNAGDADAGAGEGEKI
jgi:hypothetical protein